MLPWAFRMASLSFMSVLWDPRERYLSSTESWGMMFFSLSFLREPIALFSDLTFLSRSTRTPWKTSGGSASNLTGLPSSSLTTCFFTSCRATW